MARPHESGASIPPVENTPISYRANVNRQKTRKWAEAKTPDYGGDDWGDEEDEYSIPPPSATKPTGLRQQGQGLDSPGGAETNIAADAASSKKTYGDLRSTSAPRARSNSFTQDDEKREFSSAMVRQASPAPSKTAQTSIAPATRFSQMGIAGTRSPGSLPPLSTQHAEPSSSIPFKMRSTTSPIAESPRADNTQLGRIESNEGDFTPGIKRRSGTGESGSVYSQPPGVSPADSGSIYSQPSQPARVNTGGSSALYTPMSAGTATSTDMQDRADYPPSALPAPLTSRGLPSSGITETTSTRFPARKSSLGQTSAPDPVELARSPQGVEGSKPWIGASGRSTSPSATPRPSANAKAVPFVRPADIYRRVEEERVKERQSIESGRPSMEAIYGSRVSQDTSPTRAGLEAKTSSESLGNSRARTSSIGRDDTSDNGRSALATLESVQETKSEHGYENLDLGHSRNGLSSEVNAAQPLAQHAVQKTSLSSASPKIPDLQRVSGFGDDMFSQASSVQEQSSVSREVADLRSLPAAPSDDHSLRNQPSLGLRTAVRQAFSRPDDPMPENSEFRGGSDVQRAESTSTGTTGISPIMSRAPSSVHPDSREREPSTPRVDKISEEPETQRVETPRVPSHSMSRDATPSMPSDLPVDESLMSRPIVGREASFRPALPGGWVSYAPSISSNVTQAEDLPVSVSTSSQSNTTVAQTVSKSPAESDEVTPTGPSHQLPRILKNAPEIIQSEALLRSATPSSEKQDIREIRASRNVGSGSSNRLSDTASHEPALVDPRPDSSVSGPPSKTNPPPIDSPLADFPKPTPPLKTKGRDNADTQASSVKYTSEPQISSVLDTESHDPGDYNDKLEDEIVNSLTPRTSGIAAFDYDVNLGPVSQSERGRESTCFPSEYDSYWASTAEEQMPAPLASSVPLVGLGLGHRQQTIEVTSPQAPDDGVNQADHLNLRPQLRSRFSWEKSTEKLKGLPAEDQLRGGSTKTVEAIESTTTSLVADHEAHAALPPTVAREPPNGVNDQSQIAPPGAAEHRRGSSNLTVPPSPNDEQSAEAQASQPPPHQKQLPMPSHQTTSKQDLVPASMKDIATMPLTYQRIEALRAARQNYAIIPSGLEDWIMALKFGIDEHRNATNAFGGSGYVSSALPGSARNKFAKAMGSGGAAQQPYYQQYLNASHPSPHSSRNSPAGPSSLQQGLTQGNKLSTQQVQAKGKELLHTAGIFGGKAGKAGKGLLAKGKSKLRGVGGEKETTSSPSRTKKEQRRSSWNKSSAQSHPPGPPGPTGETQTPAPRLGTNTLSMAERTSAVKRGSMESPLTRHEPRQRRSLSPTRGSQQHNNLTQPVDIHHRPRTPVDRIRVPNDLSPPVPISKEQPTWDSYNADPIEEERESLLSNRLSGILPVKKGSTQMKPSDNLDDSNIVEKDEIEIAAFAPLTIGPFSSYKFDQERPMREVEAFRLAPMREGASTKPIAQVQTADPRVTALTGINPPLQSTESATTQETGHQQTEENKIMTVAKGFSKTDLNTASKQNMLDRPRGASLDVGYTNFDQRSQPTTYINRPFVNGQIPVATSSRSTKPEPKLQQEVTPPRRSILDRPRGTSLYQEDTSPGRTGLTSAIRQSSVHDQDQVLEREETPAIGGNRVLTPPDTSMMNRRRGASLDVGTPGSYRPRGPSATTEPTSSSVPMNVSAHNRDKGSSLDIVRHMASTAVKDTAFPQRTRGGSLDAVRVLSQIPQQHDIASGPPSFSRLLAVENEEENPSRQTSFKGLPPIRRTSTFGFTFGTRHSKSRFTIDDDDEDSSIRLANQPPLGRLSPDLKTRSSINHEPENLAKGLGSEYDEGRLSKAEPRSRKSEESWARRSSSERGIQYGQSSFNQTTEPHSSITEPAAAVNDSQNQPRNPQETRQAITLIPAAHETNRSWDAGAKLQHSLITDLPQRGRAVSGSGLASTEIYQHRRNVKSTSSEKQYEEPPSSAQRYPQLFRPELIESEMTDLPPDYYQRPISRDEAFFSRQQTNEYEIGGIGPPEDPPRPSSSRRSSFVKEMGHRISRSSSRDQRELTPSVSRQDDVITPGVDFDFQLGPDAKKGKRASFFGSLARASTGGFGSPKASDVSEAPYPASRIDLVNSPTTSGRSEARKSFMEGVKKLTRASTADAPHDETRKSRFTNVTNLFNRTFKESEQRSSPQAAEEVFQGERRRIETPQPFGPDAESGGSPPSSRTRRLFGRLGTPSRSPHPRERRRRPSTSDLLSGFFGKKSNQETQLQGGPSRPPTMFELRRDVQSQSSDKLSPPAPSPGPSQGFGFRKASNARPQVRPSSDYDRPTHRASIAIEPSHDNVSIPGGYNLVSAHGSRSLPPDYDTRRNNRSSQADPQDKALPMIGRLSSHGQSPKNTSGPPTPAKQPFLAQRDHRPPALGALETFEDYQERVGRTRRLSSEDLLARSPARAPKDQQRPYQLSLPDENASSSPSSSSPSRRGRQRAKSAVESAQVSQLSFQGFTRTPSPKPLSIPRLISTPSLRHPESPASYPLPRETAETCSPVNESARNAPLPPLPPAGFNNFKQYLQAHHDNSLTRSNTKHSEVSRLSSPGALSVPTPDGDASKDRTPSPTPPSVHVSPEQSPRPSVALPAVEHPSSAPSYEASKKELPPRPPHSTNPSLQPSLGGSLDLQSAALPRASANWPLQTPIPPPPKDDTYTAASTRPQTPALESTHEPENILDPQLNTKVSPADKLSMPGGWRDNKSVQSGGLGTSTSTSISAGGEDSDKQVHPAEGGLEVAPAEEGLEVNEEEKAQQMSATSYPGMEWNPYANGEEWE